ncbi:MAG: universal stress protein [Blastocatellia bacterium]|nr:universal stress protein [Blastocatellia bacterium]
MKDKERMKIMLAYDGSECAESAIEDLKRAGLPVDAEVQVLSIVEELHPVMASMEGVNPAFPEYALEQEKASLALAEQGAAQIRSQFPRWKVTVKAGVGSPGTAILFLADEWRPALVIVGSHGRRAIGRLLLGSVSQKVVGEAHCSVRVARGRIVEPAGTPVRIVVGVDGSKGAELAVQAVASRHWPKESEARVINAAWTMPPVASKGMAVKAVEWVARENERVNKMTEHAMNQLRATGLRVSSVVKEEDPRRLLCHEAESWHADCIFVGARGMGRLERLLLGSVSGWVAARAHCSVEVIRSYR